ncbi:O-antigen ligase family protein [Nocardioides panacisoli]|uniref:O-antigen ligase domain-containing protein n=1 Tax=Nocardioides panacisoli TaxID=627624 RepID=A0ABP7IVF3_9ACTN
MAARPDRGIVITLAFAVLAGGLSFLATQGLIFMIGAAGLAGGLLILVLLGSERTATFLLMLAFGTAPMYRGIEGLTGGVATPTDFLLILGIVLLLPSLTHNRLRLPGLYVLGLSLVFVMGLLAALVNGTPIGDAFELAQWIFFLGGLPAIIAWWHPSVRTVDALLWSYLAGHLLSTAVALVEGPDATDRYQGLTHHPNAFALAGQMSIAIVLYLIPRNKKLWVRLLLFGIAGSAILSLILSGSRASTLVAAVLIIMIPVVERSAVSGFLLYATGALVLVALPFLAASGGKGSALTRLTGGGTAAAADASRSEGIQYGFSRFWDSPIFGSGLNQIELIHNIFLEVLDSVGVFGAVGYLCVLYTLARPLFSHHPLRRLSYMAWALIGVAAALPGLWDRTIWIPLSLAILTVLPVKDGTEPEPTPAPAVRRRPAGSDLRAPAGLPLRRPSA